MASVSFRQAGHLLVQLSLLVLLPASAVSQPFRVRTTYMGPQPLAVGIERPLDNWSYASLPSWRYRDQYSAVPWKKKCRVRITRTDGERSVIVPVWDVGPWNTDNPYWEADAATRNDLTWDNLRLWWDGDGTIRNPPHRYPLHIVRPDGSVEQMPNGWIKGPRSQGGNDEDFPVDADHPPIYDLSQGTSAAWEAFIAYVGEPDPYITPSSYDYGCSRFGRHRQSRISL